MKNLVALIALFIPVLVLRAQEPLPKALTFEEAVNIALRNSVMLNQERNQLAINQIQKSAAIASMAPSISANLFAQQFNGNSFDQQQGQVVNGVRDAVRGNISANLTLFNGFNQLNTLKQNNNLLEAQSYNLKRTQEDIINTVSIQYLQVLLDEELLKIARENYESQNAQYNQVKEQVALGARSPVDEYNQLSLAKGAELRMLQAETTLNNDKAILTQTLLTDPFEEFQVVKPHWDIGLITGHAITLEEMYNTAKENRGDYIRAERNETAARFGVAATRGGLTPTLSAFFENGSAYNFIRNVPDSVLAQNPSLNRPFEDQFGKDNRYKTYGLNLSIPILNGLQSRNRLVQNKVAYENARINTRNVEVTLKADVLRTSRNFDLAKRSYTVSQTQAEAAEVAFQFESERYNLGVTNFVDFAQANRAMVQAQTDRAQAEYRLLFQKILLEYAMGTLKVEGLQQ